MAKNREAEIRDFYEKIIEAIKGRQVICVFGRINPSKKERLLGLYENHVVIIDITGDIVDSIFHEVLHYIKPMWDDRQVVPRTRYAMKILSVNELYKLLKIAVDNAIWLEENFDEAEDIAELKDFIK